MAETPQCEDEVRLHLAAQLELDEDDDDPAGLDDLLRTHRRGRRRRGCPRRMRLGVQA